MSQDSQQEFSRFRRYFWPIHGHELPKLAPMLLMAFFISFAYNILRNMKDSLLVTAQGSGAEAIPFVKVWAMLPMAVLLTAIFVRLSHRYSSERVFYIIVTGFLTFYLVFAAVLYPLRDTLHPHAFAERLQLILPQGFKGLIAMFRYWTFSLFYGMSELWGVGVLSILFWGYANEITGVTQAKRFYGLLSVGANLSSIVAGQVSCFLCTRLYNPGWPLGADAWHQSLILLTLCVLLAGGMVMLVFKWLTTRVVNKMGGSVDPVQARLAKVESKPSMRESFAYLAKSKYLLSTAVIVVSYNIVINLVEVLWKDQVRLLHPDPSAYNTYMGHVTSFTGIVATVLGLFVSGNVIRKCGWTVAAMLTPAILLVTSIAFFTFYLFPNDHLAVFTSLLGTTPIALVAFLGSAQNCMCRACKYTVFDATKELAFIPLSRESRVKGKAAIDGVGSRMGKSGGSVIYQGLLMLFRNLTYTAPYVAGILIAILAGWVLSIRNVGRLFTQLTTDKPAPTARPESTISEPLSQQAV